MLTSDPALAALLMFLNVAPVALYFLFLGLVNSHATPCRISSRSDFVALTSVMAPLLFWPVPAMAASHYWWVIALEVLAATWAFLRLLPDRDAGWVVYNISEGCWRSAWEAAARSAGVDGAWDGKRWLALDGTHVMTYHSLSVLRNISVEVKNPRLFSQDRGQKLAARLDAQFQRIEQLPSTTGACLWILGVALMLMPLWILGRHAHDVVTALARLFG